MKANLLSREESLVLPEPVRALAKVHREREAGSETRAYICLDRNERLEPFPDWFVQALRDSLDSDLLTKYPVQDKFHQRLCDELKVSEEQLLLTAGSDAAVKALYQAYVAPGDAVVMLDPSYAMYQVYARVFQAKTVAIPFTKGLSVDSEILLERVTSDVRLIMIANPNQPTGTLLTEDCVRRLLERAAGIGALVAVDEAYYPFSMSTVLSWIDQFPHLLVIRSFSKAAGLAGLRIGFVAGHRDVVGNLFKVRSTYDVNGMAILCASQLLKHPQVIKDYTDRVESGRKLLAQRLKLLGLTPLPSHTNFMLVRVGHCYSPAEVVEALKNCGYLVKGPFGAACISDCIRVTLGPPALMATFADVLEQILSGQARSVSR